MESEILNIAQELFLNQGPKMVTMDDISTRAGVSKKTLYQNYPSKEDLLVKVHLQMHENILLILAGIRSKKLNAIEELFSVQESIFEYVKADSEAFMHQLMIYYPKVYQKNKEQIYSCMHDFLVENMEIGKNTHLYRQDLNSNLVASFFFAVHQSIKEGSLYSNLEIPTIKIEQECLLFFLNSFVGNKGRQILETIKTSQ